jgi:hypothetical protein
MSTTQSASATDPLITVKLIAAWLFVAIPLAWGVWVTLQNAVKLFQ